MPEQYIIELISYCIKKKLGDIDDIPLELANTIANVYYNSIDQAIKKWHKENPDTQSFNQDRQNDYEKLVMLNLADPDSLKDIKMINKMISSYRDIKETETQRTAKYIGQMIIDTMKYKIKNAPEKSELKRWFERRIKKKNITEIPGLIEMLTVKQNQ